MIEGDPELALGADEASTESLEANDAITPEKLKQSIENVVSEKIITEKTKEAFAENLELSREETRSQLARWLIYILAGTLFCSFLVMGASVFIEAADKDAAKDLVTLVLTTQTGLIGTALGFYFANK